jgi:prepilin-type N-terminal cleavage/methylation domain-containing protein/prepilin-type processing-associated H-X9-DG protein
LLGHDLHTPNAKSLVKQSCFCSSFSLSFAPHAQYDALLTKKTMTKSSPPPVGRGFTLIELLVVIAVIFVIAGIAIPAFHSAFERAKILKDTSNLRQIGAATQLYMNDNNGAFPGSPSVTWMSQLALNQKYLSSWRVLESPFDNRTTSEKGDATTAVSYGINANVLPGNVAISADKITKPVTFIVFAPAQAAGQTVSFQGTAGANSPPPGVTVLAATSTPGGAGVLGGPHNNRTKINALFADWHAETMWWRPPPPTNNGPAFISKSDPGNDSDAQYRWCPQPQIVPCP